MVTDLVYLAGPIANISGCEAIDWRKYATSELHDYSITVRDPMREKRHPMKDMTKISADFTTYKEYGIFFTSRAIMTRDFNDVKQSDVVLVNLLNAQVPSLGTVMEMAWAFAMQKPCVVAIEPDGNPHDKHPMIHEAMSFRVSTLDEAIHAVAVILGRG